THRIAGANQALVGHSCTPIGTLGRKPVEDATPECCESIGRGAAAKAPAPETRCRHDHYSPWLVRADKDGTMLLTTSSPSFHALPRALRDYRRECERRKTVPQKTGERWRQRRRRRGRWIPLAVGRRCHDQGERPKRYGPRRSERRGVAMQNRHPSFSDGLSGLRLPD